MTHASEHLHLPQDSWYTNAYVSGMCAYIIKNMLTLDLIVALTALWQVNWNFTLFLYNPIKRVKHILHVIRPERLVKCLAITCLSLEGTWVTWLCNSLGSFRMKPIQEYSLCKIGLFGPKTWNKSQQWSTLPFSINNASEKCMMFRKNIVHCRTKSENRSCFCFMFC